MDVELRFRETPTHNHIAYLKPAGAAPDGGTTVSSPEDFDTLVREVMGASNAFREIMVVGSEAAAREIAMLRREDQGGEAILTQLDESTFALGLTNSNGLYDSGMPDILDLRAEGALLELVGAFPADQQVMTTREDPLEFIQADEAWDTPAP